jgi:hypothetical protein
MLCEQQYYEGNQGGRRDLQFAVATGATPTVSADYLVRVQLAAVIVTFVEVTSDYTSCQSKFILSNIVRSWYFYFTYLYIVQCPSRYDSVKLVSRN